MRTFCSAVIVGGLALLAGATTAPRAEAAACTEIHTIAEFQAISRNPDGSYCLAQDLDARGASIFPIPSFNGMFDGRGFAIRNLSIVSNSSLVGVFGEIDFAT